MQHTCLPLLDGLLMLANDSRKERIMISDVMSVSGDRAALALILLFALPNVMPVPPGTSAVLGAPLLFLAAQAALGKKAWLPPSIAGRSISRARFAAWVDRGQLWLARAGGLLRPRLQWLADPAPTRVVGALCLVLALILFLPIPLGNMPPALAISMLALGVLERDGVWVLAGIAIGLVSVAVAWSSALIVARALAGLLMRVLG
jgi:hypothetical protein